MYNGRTTKAYGIPYGSNQDFISLLLFLDITFIWNLEQFLAVLLFFKFSFGRLVIVSSLLFLFTSFFVSFFYLLGYFVSFFFFFFNFCFYSRRFLKCILSFSKMDRYV